MTWIWLLVGVVIYLLFDKTVGEVKRWLAANKDLLDKWKQDPEIVKAFEELKAIVKAAKLDAHWSPTEIILTVAAGIRLFTLIKKFEERENE